MSPPIGTTTSDKLTSSIRYLYRWYVSTDLYSLPSASNKSKDKASVNFTGVFKEDVLDKITLFGFSAEEMLEAGAEYEDVLAFGGMVR